MTLFREQRTLNVSPKTMTDFFFFSVAAILRAVFRDDVRARRRKRRGYDHGNHDRDTRAISQIKHLANRGSGLFLGIFDRHSLRNTG